MKCNLYITSSKVKGYVNFSLSGIMFLQLQGKKEKTLLPPKFEIPAHLCPCTVISLGTLDVATVTLMSRSDLSTWATCPWERV